MINWLGERVGVYGYGRTGKACVDYLRPQLISPVVLIDQASPEQQAALNTEAGGRFELAFGAAIGPAVERLDALILSPGVPLKNPHVQRAVERGIPVVSELEVAARNCPGYLLAVTGTNGKSTTTKILGHVLSALGPSHVLGNIGVPLLGSLAEIGEGDYVALEVSSYQLEAIERFAPHVAIYTNLTPDHLDRHGTIEEYARVKRQMAINMDESGFIVANALCGAFSRDSFENNKPTYLQYRSVPGGRLHGAWVANNMIHVDLGYERHELSLDCVKLPGIHNIENALAVIVTAFLMGATAETVAERLSGFTGYEHRLERCPQTLGNVRFFNDSKATNPEATITALKAMDPPLALILGGRDKMTDLAEMCAWIKRKVRHAVLIGEAAGRFAAALAAAGVDSVQLVDNLELAVPAAVEALAPDGGTVLLSPACASFDQYGSYEERGEHFKEVVAGLAGTTGGARAGG
ncbi:UDP-N-acetylmuramoyl-L-alanine--D-glutamate ligase [bacterium]|nr:UDP-N-acetylmuramoyl-L-alanine--D-glutamate ligase [bacterium]